MLECTNEDDVQKKYHCHRKKIRYSPDPEKTKKTWTDLSRFSQYDWLIELN